MPTTPRNPTPVNINDVKPGDKLLPMLHTPSLSGRRRYDKHNPMTVTKVVALPPAPGHPAYVDVLDDADRGNPADIHMRITSADLLAGKWKHVPLTGEERALADTIAEHVKPGARLTSKVTGTLYEVRTAGPAMFTASRVRKLNLQDPEDESTYLDDYEVVFEHTKTVMEHFGIELPNTPMPTPMPIAKAKDRPTGDDLYYMNDAVVHGANILPIEFSEGDPELDDAVPIIADTVLTLPGRGMTTEDVKVAEDKRDEFMEIVTAKLRTLDGHVLTPGVEVRDLRIGRNYIVLELHSDEVLLQLKNGFENQSVEHLPLDPEEWSFVSGPVDGEKWTTEDDEKSLKAEGATPPSLPKAKIGDRELQLGDIVSYLYDDDEDYEYRVVDIQPTTIALSWLKDGDRVIHRPIPFNHTDWFFLRTKEEDDSTPPPAQTPWNTKRESLAVEPQNDEVSAFLREFVTNDRSAKEPAELLDVAISLAYEAKAVLREYVSQNAKRASLDGDGWNTKTAMLTLEQSRRLERTDMLARTFSALSHSARSEAQDDLVENLQRQSKKLDGVRKLVEMGMGHVNDFQRAPLANPAALAQNLSSVLQAIDIEVKR